MCRKWKIPYITQNIKNELIFKNGGQMSQFLLRKNVSYENKSFENELFTSIIEGGGTER